jgi:hypothetical protein
MTWDGSNKISLTRAKVVKAKGEICSAINRGCVLVAAPRVRMGSKARMQRYVLLTVDLTGKFCPLAGVPMYSPLTRIAGDEPPVNVGVYTTRR